MNKEIIKKSQKTMETQPSVLSPMQKQLFGTVTQKILKNRYQRFSDFLNFPQNILGRIVDEIIKNFQYLCSE